MDLVRHHRTASKNLQSFRFICRYEPTDPLLINVSCLILFKFSDDWKEFKKLDNITSANMFSIFYVFEEYLDIKLQIIYNEQVADEKIVNIVTLVSNLHNSLDFRSGKFHLDVEEIKDNNSALSLKISAKISGGFLFWRPHYSLHLFRLTYSNDFLEIYSSESAPGSKCCWQKFTLPYNVLGSGQVRIQIKNSSKEIVAELELSVSQLLSPGQKFDLKSNPGKKNTLKISWSELELKQNFIDYLRSGLKIKVITAIDYTTSNLPYSVSTSNHYLSSKPNSYEDSLKRIIEVLDVYNRDKIIHLFGFGGVPPRQSKVNHCFRLGQVTDAQSLIALYRETLPNIGLSKPTIMNEIINEAQRICLEDRDVNSYYVMIILTDGDIHDFPVTLTSIVYSCRFPLSFIIIGIGNSDFTSMVRLDSDGQKLKDREGRIAERDIVQFVPYEQYRYNPELLAAKVLEEIPEQICGYMTQKSFVPVL